VNEEITALEQSIFAAAGEEFVIGSPQQLGAILFEKLGLSRKRRGKTGLLDRRPRARGDPLRARDRADDRALARALDAAQDLPRAAAGQVDAASRLHTTFLQTVASTGRLSSTNPNLQNIPIRTPLGREIRACFVARPARAGLRRLLADRAARARAAGRRAGAEGDLPPTARTSTRRPPARSSRSSRTRSTPACARRRR
jgi:DNA polymerase I-like protein with 3'-5' exonuclease and polymerase domains